MPSDAVIELETMGGNNNAVAHGNQNQKGANATEVIQVDVEPSSTSHW